MTNKEIISNIRAGGRQLEEVTLTLMNLHQGLMHTIKQKLNLPLTDIKDLYADSISHLIWNIQRGKFKGESKVSTYLYRIFYNKAVDHLRHISTNKNAPTVELDSYDAPSLIDVEQNAYDSIEFEAVKSEISKLGSPCQGVLIDWAHYGYSMQEIAARNQLDNADKAKKVKYSCLQKLRIALKAKNMY